ncbi:MAG: NYN domain-containing protein [Clostridia bacterium]|nr:NYN domain-containing protein [Clostridia bacterium]
MIYQNIQLNDPGGKYDNYRTDLVATVCYLAGLSDDKMEMDQFSKEKVAELRKDDRATTIRYLCSIRMQIFRNYKQISAAKFQPGSETDNFEKCFDKDQVKFLREKGIEFVHVNMKGTSSIFMNVAYINQYILDNIDKIKPLIPDWIKFEYIRSLFLMPKCNAGPSGSLVLTHQKQQNVFSNIRNEMNSYNSNKNSYPYQLFIMWPYTLSEKDGNVLFNDEKFLKMLYGANRDIFKAREYVIDAPVQAKESFYDFVSQAGSVAIFVDCENVTPYSFVGMLKGLDAANISKIREIVLYDDEHTSTAWDYVSSYVDLDIPITHKEIERVLDNKSLIDTVMTAGVCKSYYEDHVDSVVLASSDSDFWGLITTVSLAKYYILNERSRTSQTIIDRFDQKGIEHCFMDDFAQDKVQLFKTQVLLGTLRKRISNFNETGIWQDMDANQLVDSLFREAYITGADTQMEQEKKTFINTYLKGGFTIKYSEDAEGNRPFRMELNRK